MALQLKFEQKTDLPEMIPFLIEFLLFLVILVLTHDLKLKGMCPKLIRKDHFDPLVAKKIGQIVFYD